MSAYSLPSEFSRFVFENKLTLPCSQVCLAKVHNFFEYTRLPLICFLFYFLSSFRPAEVHGNPAPTVLTLQKYNLSLPFPGSQMDVEFWPTLNNIHFNKSDFL